MSEPVEQLVTRRCGTCVVAEPDHDLHHRQAGRSSESTIKIVPQSCMPQSSRACSRCRSCAGNPWKSSLRRRAIAARRLRHSPLGGRPASEQATSSYMRWACGGSRGGSRRGPRGGGVSSYRPTGGRNGMTERVLGPTGSRRRKWALLLAPLAALSLMLVFALGASANSLLGSKFEIDDPGGNRRCRPDRGQQLHRVWQWRHQLASTGPRPRSTRRGGATQRPARATTRTRAGPRKTASVRAKSPARSRTTSLT